jgi:hypothetical protein
MSLAMYASDFNNEENIRPTQKNKSYNRNKTLKRKDTNKPNPKVESMLHKIHENDESDDDNNYQPIQPPSSAGIERMENNTMNNIKHYSEQYNENNMSEQENTGNPSSTSQQEGFTQLPSEYAKQYYQQYIPYYNQSSDDLTPNGANKDELLSKLNEIVYLLEEQQNEKSGNVTEELILYSFLGVFMIFIVDSFARVGKYVR